MRRHWPAFGGVDRRPGSVAAGSETRYQFAQPSAAGWPPQPNPAPATPHHNTPESILRNRIAALTASEARFVGLTLLGSDWYWDQDANFCFTAISGNLVDSVGAVIEQHLGRALWDLPQIEPPPGGWDAHRRCLAAHDTFHDLVLRRPRQGGGANYVSISGEPVFDENGTFIGYRGIGLDITRQKLIEAKTSRLAHFDPLTSVYNRTAFFERLNHALAVARRHDRSIALLFIDLDRFKDGPSRA